MKIDEVKRANELVDRHTQLMNILKLLGEVSGGELAITRVGLKLDFPIGPKDRVRSLPDLPITTVTLCYSREVLKLKEELRNMGIEL